MKSPFRMALGASAGDVRSMVVTSSLRFVLMGVAAGIALVWVSSGLKPLEACGD